VHRIEQLESGGYRIHLAPEDATGAGSGDERGDATRGEAVVADAVVLATPAPTTAALLRPLSEAAADELGSITHSSPVLVTLVYDRDDVPAALDASGFLVPRDAGLFLTAASFGSTKWAHWDDGRHVVLRVSAGHSGDDRPDRMSDDEIVAALREDLRTVMGIDRPARDDPGLALPERVRPVHRRPPRPRRADRGGPGARPAASARGGRRLPGGRHPCVHPPGPRRRPTSPHVGRWVTPTMPERIRPPERRW
jgi:hypothetical protein